MNTKTFRQSTDRCPFALVKMANQAHRCVVQFRLGAFLTAWVPALANFVGHIFGSGAEKMVTWIATRGIVTTRTIMEDTQAIGDRTVLNFPGQTMRKDVSSASASAADYTIARFICAADPRPTGIGTVPAIHFCIEPIKERGARILVGHIGPPSGVSCLRLLAQRGGFMLSANYTIREG